MDFYQLVAWKQLYIVGADFETLMSNESIHAHFRYRIRPLGRILEQAVLTGTLLNALYPMEAKGELVAYAVRFRSLCVSALPPRNAYS